jgi:PPOX class probable F420-dependent enzyme
MIQAMRTMNEAEYKRFLRAGTLTAKAATVRADGRPHVTPIWFSLDGDDLIFTTHETSVKALAFRRDPRICLCVDDEMPPFAYVMIEGTVTLSDDLSLLLHWATIIGGRYMGADRAVEYGRRNGVPGELLVRVTPDKVIARAGIAE